MARDTLLNDIHASASDALEALEAGDLQRCRTMLQAILDGLRERLDTEEEG